MATNQLVGWEEEGQDQNGQGEGASGLAAAEGNLQQDDTEDNNGESLPNGVSLGDLLMQPPQLPANEEEQVEGYDGAPRANNDNNQNLNDWASQLGAGHDATVPATGGPDEDGGGSFGQFPIDHGGSAGGGGGGGAVPSPTTAGGNTLPSLWGGGSGSGSGPILAQQPQVPAIGGTAAPLTPSGWGGPLPPNPAPPPVAAAPAPVSFGDNVNPLQQQQQQGLTNEAATPGTPQPELINTAPASPPTTGNVDWPTPSSNTPAPYVTAGEVVHAPASPPTTDHGNVDWPSSNTLEPTPPPHPTTSGEAPVAPPTTDHGNMDWPTINTPAPLPPPRNPAPVAEILTESPVVVPAGGSAPTDTSNEEHAWPDEPSQFPPHDAPAKPKKETQNSGAFWNGLVTGDHHCDAKDGRLKQASCRLVSSLRDHPLSWLVVLLALYGVNLIRRRRQRHAASVARGEYRQVAARFADTAFDDHYSPAENVGYLSDDDDEAGWDDDNNNNNGGSIQMKDLGRGDRLNLEETNG